MTNIYYILGNKIKDIKARDMVPRVGERVMLEGSVIYEVISVLWREEKDPPIVDVTIEEA